MMCSARHGLPDHCPAQKRLCLRPATAPSLAPISTASSTIFASLLLLAQALAPRIRHLSGWTWTQKCLRWPDMARPHPLPATLSATDRAQGFERIPQAFARELWACGAAGVPAAVGGSTGEPSTMTAVGCETILLRTGELSKCNMN